MYILLGIIASYIPRIIEFLNRLPTGTFLTFAACFGIASLLGKAIGGVVNDKVLVNKNKNTAIVPTSSRSKTQRSSPNNNKKPANSSAKNMTSSAANYDTDKEKEEPRKAGVASPDELQQFVDQAGDRLLVIDTRNPDFSVEPGDQKSLAVAGLPTESFRVQAKHLPYNRTSNTMPELPPNTPKDTPMITHCGAGTRGQLAKEYLEQQGFTNVMNGGGPKEKDCWAVYGDK